MPSLSLSPHLPTPQIKLIKLNYETKFCRSAKNALLRASKVSARCPHAVGMSVFGHGDAAKGAEQFPGTAVAVEQKPAPKQIIVLDHPHASAHWSGTVYDGASSLITINLTRLTSQRGCVPYYGRYHPRSDQIGTGVRKKKRI